MQLQWNPEGKKDLVWFCYFHVAASGPSYVNYTCKKNLKSSFKIKISSSFDCFILMFWDSAWVVETIKPLGIVEQTSKEASVSPNWNIYIIALVTQELENKRKNSSFDKAYNLRTYTNKRKTSKLQTLQKHLHQNNNFFIYFIE